MPPSAFHSFSQIAYAKKHFVKCVKKNACSCRCLSGFTGCGCYKYSGDQDATIKWPILHEEEIHLFYLVWSKMWKLYFQQAQTGRSTVTQAETTFFLFLFSFFWLLETVTFSSLILMYMYVRGFSSFVPMENHTDHGEFHIKHGLQACTTTATPTVFHVNSVNKEKNTTRCLFMHQSISM